MSGFAVALVMVAIEIAALLPLATFPALLPQFVAAWGLSNTEAGTINGVFYIGYMLAVPFLMAWTDRIDARRILIGGLALSAFGNLGFAAFADGVGSGMAWRFVAGIGLAGVYMPGLRALTDRLGQIDQSRAVTFYTANYSVGVGLSYLLAGLADAAWGWRWAAAIAGVGPLIAIAPALLLLAPHAPPPAKGPRRLLDFRPVIANPVILAFVLAYGAHGFELTAMRGWVTAFLESCLVRLGQSPGVFTPTIVAALVTVIGLPASLLGNELAMRLGRRVALIGMMTASGLVGLVLGLLAGFDYGLVVAVTLVYAVLVAADSGALTAGVVAASTPETRGAVLAVHSTVGFGTSFLGPFAVGVTLDAAGGAMAPGAWAYAFAIMAAGVLAGPLVLWRLTGRP